MTSKLLLGAACVAALTFAASGAAQAQSRSRAASSSSSAAPSTAVTPRSTTTAAAPAAPAAPLKSGPPIAGVCVFSEERAVGTSAAGKAANARMQQLRAQVQAELQPEGTTLQNDLKTFQAQRATLQGDALTQRQQGLEQRIQAYQQKEQLRGQELQATGEKALGRIRQEIDPVVRGVYEQRNCSLLLNADGAVFGGNPQMDITDGVVTALNTKLPTISFDREHIDPAQLAAAQQRQ